MFCFHELSCMAICGTHLAYPTPYYRVHHGKNRFCCWGHGVHARDMCIFHLSLFLLVGVTILFFVYEARFLTPLLSPAIPTFAAILFLYVLLTFLRTAFTDPGILPRATAAETEWTKLYLAAATPLNNATVTSESVPVPQSFNPDSYTRDVLIRDHLVRLNFCHSCGFFRPPRSSHCSTCDNCVDRFDHHCPWVGNCVGRRNYRYFILFLYSLSIYCAYIFVFAVTNLVLLYKSNENLLVVIRTSPGSPVEIFLSFFTLWTVCGLSGYHTSLICREISTHEDIRRFPRALREAGHRNPFSHKSGCSNFIYFLCGPQQPNFLRGWRYVTGNSWSDDAHDLDIVRANVT